VILYLAIPIGYFFDWIVFGLGFDSLEVIGAAIICFVNIFITVMRLTGCIE